MRKTNHNQHPIRIFILVLVLLGFLAQIAPAQKKITSPEEFFGFQMGSDRKIARWDKIIDYFVIAAVRRSECAGGSSIRRTAGVQRGLP